MSIKQGDYLKKLRTENKLSQEKLAEKLGVSRQSISKWEQGYAVPDTDNMFKILSVLAAGAVLGLLLRRISIVRRFGGALQYTVYAMLFVLGLSVGTNPGIMSRLGETGLQALLLASAGIAGSILAVLIAGRLFPERKEDRR